MPAKIARSAARPPFGLPEMLVAVHTSRLSCREAEKAPIFMPVQESSGESKINYLNPNKSYDGLDALDRER